MSLKYRDGSDPDVPCIPTLWSGPANERELGIKVRRREYLGDLTVAWAEIYEHDTGTVLVRYEHPALRMMAPVSPRPMTDGSKKGQWVHPAHIHMGD